MTKVVRRNNRIQLIMDLSNLTDRELDQLLTEWGREQRAVLDLHAQAAEARGRAIIMQRIQELSAKTPAAAPATISAKIEVPD